MSKTNALLFRGLNTHLSTGTTSLCMWWSPGLCKSSSPSPTATPRCITHLTNTSSSPTKRVILRSYIAFCRIQLQLPWARNSSSSKNAIKNVFISGEGTPEFESWIYQCFSPLGKQVAFPKIHLLATEFWLNFSSLGFHCINSSNRTTGFGARDRTCARQHFWWAISLVTGTGMTMSTQCSIKTPTSAAEG